jgi:hypothetical protein
MIIEMIVIIIMKIRKKKSLILLRTLVLRNKTGSKRH